eukprot:c16105_g2_i1 orf=3-479(-)
MLLLVNTKRFFYELDHVSFIFISSAQARNCLLMESLSRTVDVATLESHLSLTEAPVLSSSDSELVLVPLPRYPSMPRLYSPSRKRSSSASEKSIEQALHGGSQVHSNEEAAMFVKVMFKVKGMECSACASSVEKAVKRLHGIQDASIAVLHSTAQVVYC